MTAELSTILAELRRRLEAIYGDRLEKILLFGSQARGDAEPGSDIDVLIVLKGDVSPGQEIARAGGVTAALSLEHDVVISCVHVSAERYANEQSPLLAINVHREGTAV